MISDGCVQWINRIRNVSFIDSLSLLVCSHFEHFLSFLFLPGIENIWPLLNFSLIDYPAITKEKLFIRFHRQRRQALLPPFLILNAPLLLLLLMLH